MKDDDQFRAEQLSDNPEESDVELARRCRAELPYNTLAFELLVSRYEATVHRTCRHYLSSDADAEEVTQEVFLRVFRGIERFSEKASFRTWLFRIVHNECATRYGKIKRTTEGRKDYIRERMLEPHVAQIESSQVSKMSDRVQTALAALAEDDRHVLVLRFISDLSIKEVARTLGIKLSAAKMRLYRAQERFRERYEQASSSG